MKKTTPIIMLLILLVLPSTLALYPLCMDIRAIKENCTMLTPELRGLSSYNYSAINLSKTIIDHQDLGTFNLDIYYINVTYSAGDYIIKLSDGSTREIRVLEEDSTRMIIGALILIPVLFGIILIIASATMDAEDHSVFKIFLFLLAFIMFWISLYFGGVAVAKFYDFADMQTAITTTLWIMGIMFFVIVSYYSIYIIKTGFKQASEDNAEIRY